MKNSKCAVSKLFNKNGRPSMCGIVNKKKDHAETQQRRRIEKKIKMSTISDEESQKATGCAPPKRLRIKPDPEEDVNPEVLNVTQES